MKFNFRVDNLELRSCDKFLTANSKHNTAEIVEWFDDGKHCYTLAYWEEDKEGYDLRFVGDRPFTVDSKAFWELAKRGQGLLQEIIDSDNLE